MLAIRFVLSIFGFNQGALGIGEDKGDKLVIMINALEETDVIVLIDVDLIGAVETAGEDISFQDIELHPLLFTYIQVTYVH
jgi:hypothetical protein